MKPAQDAASMASANMLRLEVCVDSLESALQAIEGGADRLEICSSLLYGGGMTPSHGLVKTIQRISPIPLMIMIRPRVGDFAYSDSELHVMEEDIRSFQSLGVLGFVFGVLTSDGEVDVASTQRLVEVARPCEVTFHRAFDMTKDFVVSYAAVASIAGVNRILTSGLTPKLTDGSVWTLSQSNPLAITRHEGPAPGPKILPGSGIGVSTIKGIVQELWPIGIHEYHLSGGQVVQRDFRPGSGTRSLEDMGMGPPGVWMTRSNVLRDVREAAREAIENLGKR